MKLLRGADRKKSPRVELWSTTTIRGQMHEEEQAKETKNQWPERLRGNAENYGAWKPGDVIVSRAENVCQMLCIVQ